MSRVSSMGELTASLAHELNQPLTAIASNAAAGRRFLAQGPPETQGVRRVARRCGGGCAASGRYHSWNPPFRPQGRRDAAPDKFE